MRKSLPVILTAVLIIGAFLLSACNSKGDLDSRYGAYSDAVKAAATDLNSFYVKYNSSSEPGVTYKLNFSVDGESGRIKAVWDKETSTAVSISHEYIYFGHALPAGVKERDAKDSDYRTALFVGDQEPRFDVTPDDFFAMTEISSLIPENIVSPLVLGKETMHEVDGTPFSSTQGVAESFSFTLSDPDNRYYSYCSDGNFLVVRAIQGRVNKVFDARGTFSYVIDYVGPDITMPTF